MEAIQNLIPETIGGVIYSKRTFKLHVIYIYIGELLLIYVLLFIHLILRLEIEGSGKTWKQDQRIRLHHVDTDGYLHSHNKKYSRIAGGQQEVRIKPF